MSVAGFECVVVSVEVLLLPSKLMCALVDEANTCKITICFHEVYHRLGFSWRFRLV